MAAGTTLGVAPKADLELVRCFREAPDKIDGGKWKTFGSPLTVGKSLEYILRRTSSCSLWIRCNDFVCFSLTNLEASFIKIIGVFWP